ncbi:hypothetical protein GCM10009332_22830 [Shewanella gelidii]|uniref:Uncharacterized protein n=1 Tax=Shewanella gelidii TaxID=1642821 RepID=A0A917JTV7_9GAMM|nr:hypothetical protein GCM10009332_22830 [Shewanella gelidii]
MEEIGGVAGDIFAELRLEGALETGTTTASNDRAATPPLEDVVGVTLVLALSAAKGVC